MFSIAPSGRRRTSRKGIGVFPIGRSISTSSSELEPVLIYTNPNDHKGLIAKQNKGKSGVYRWVNKISGKSSVGSCSYCRAVGRPFSTLNKEIKSESSESLIPAVIYSDAFADKSVIL